MFKSLIAGVAALGLIMATPQKAEADGGDFVAGIVAGALILGTLAAINDYDDRYAHRHSHVRVKPKYGHRHHNVYRHGTRIYRDRDNRHRHDDYGYRHRDYRFDDRKHHGHKHVDRRFDDEASWHRHGDYRHKHVAKPGHHHGKKVVKHDAKTGGKKLVKAKNQKKRVKKLVAQRERLAKKNAKLRRQLAVRDRYIQSLNRYDQ